jgi:hypothetical protein
VHSVTAKVTKEVSVFLEHGDLNASPGQQQSEDHPDRATSGDRAGGGLISHGYSLFLSNRHGCNAEQLRSRRPD